MLEPPDTQAAVQAKTFIVSEGQGLPWVVF